MSMHREFTASVQTDKLNCVLCRPLERLVSQHDYTYFCKLCYALSKLRIILSRTAHFRFRF